VALAAMSLAFNIGFVDSCSGQSPMDYEPLSQHTDALLRDIEAIQAEILCRSGLKETSFLHGFHRSSFSNQFIHSH
jgi:hypothetical protein